MATALVYPLSKLPHCLLPPVPSVMPNSPPLTPCLSCRDIEDRPRFLVGVQVDVTEHPTVSDATPVGRQAANAVGQALQSMNWWAELAAQGCAWLIALCATWLLRVCCCGVPRHTNLDDVGAASLGFNVHSLHSVSALLPGCRVGVDPWATFPTGLRQPKPHRRMDPAAAALAAVVARDGKLRLRHFSRVGGSGRACLHPVGAAMSGGRDLGMLPNTRWRLLSPSAHRASAHPSPLPHPAVLRR